MTKTINVILNKTGKMTVNKIGTILTETSIVIQTTADQTIVIVVVMTVAMIVAITKTTVTTTEENVALAFSVVSKKQVGQFLTNNTYIFQSCRQQLFFKKI